MHGPGPRLAPALLGLDSLAGTDAFALPVAPRASPPSQSARTQLEVDLEGDGTLHDGLHARIDHGDIDGSTEHGAVAHTDLRARQETDGVGPGLIVANRCKRDALYFLVGRPLDR